MWLPEEWSMLQKPVGIHRKHLMKASEGADQNVRLDLKTKEDFEAIHDFLRPVLVSIQNSKRVLFDGPVFQNSPAWNIHPLMIEDLIIRNVSVRNPWFSQNGTVLTWNPAKMYWLKILLLTWETTPFASSPEKTKTVAIVGFLAKTSSSETISCITDTEV